MAEVAKHGSWRNWLPDMSAAFARFPLPVLIAGLFTAYKLWTGTPEETELKILGALAGSFFWVVAVDLFCEAHRRNAVTRAVLSLAGIAVIALLASFYWQVGLFVPIGFAFLLLVVGLAAFCWNSEGNDRFWMFNHRLWLAAALAGVGAGLFGAGLSIIAETLNFLFGIELPSRTHEHIWTVAGGFLAPVSWLALAPARFDETIGTEEEREFTIRAAAGLVKFVLVPLIFVYTAILYAYAAKIALAWTLPKGTLGNLVTGYLIVGAATLLLGYPSRESGGVLVRLFWRYWIWLALMPIALLFLALYVRISTYGITDARYLIALIGVWVLALVALRIVRPGAFDIRLVPGVLAVLLAIAAFGPWGAIGVSVRSQKAQLAGLLEAKGLLVDGKVVTKPKEGEEYPLGTSAARARGILSYLSAQHGLGTLAPWFEGRDPNPFAADKSEEDTRRDVFLAFSLPPDAPGAPGDASFFTHYAKKPEIVQLGGKGYVIGPIVFDGPVIAEAPVAPTTIPVEGLGELRLEISDRALTVTLADGAALKFDLLDTARDLANPLRTDDDPVRLEATAPGYAGTMVIDNFNGAYRETGFSLNLLRFWLVIERKG